MYKTAKYISTQTTKLFFIISRILLWIREPCHESAAQQFGGSGKIYTSDLRSGRPR